MVSHVGFWANHFMVSQQKNSQTGTQGPVPFSSQEVHQKQFELMIRAVSSQEMQSWLRDQGDLAGEEVRI